MCRFFWKLKTELECLIDHAPAAAFTAFLCAMGGILLWVSGGSWSYTVLSRAEFGLSLTVSFVIWLIAYALYGLRLGLLWFCGRCLTRRTAAACAAVLLAYLLDLVWYSLFFCTRLAVFPLIIILISSALNIFALTAGGKGRVLGKICDLAVVIVQILFVVRTVMYILLK